jgi:hypothetical protein
LTDPRLDREARRRRTSVSALNRGERRRHRNSVEPHIMHLATIDLFNVDEEWARLRRPAAIDIVKSRLRARVDDIQ